MNARVSQQGSIRVYGDRGEYVLEASGLGSIGLVFPGGKWNEGHIVAHAGLGRDSAIDGALIFVSTPPEFSAGLDIETDHDQEVVCHAKICSRLRRISDDGTTHWAFGSTPANVKIVAEKSLVLLEEPNWPVF